MQIKTLKLDLKVVVRKTGSAQGDIYSTFQEEQVTETAHSARQCVWTFKKVTSLNDQYKLQSLHLIAKRQTYYLFAWIKHRWLISW